MSYDVRIGRFDGNYTYNVSAMFHKHIRDWVSNADGTMNTEVTGLQALHGKTGKQAWPILAAAFDSLTNERRLAGHEELAHYNAPNGWGTAVGGVLFMGQIMAACMNHPRSKISVS